MATKKAATKKTKKRVTFVIEPVKHRPIKSWEVWVIARYTDKGKKLFRHDDALEGAAGRDSDSSTFTTGIVERTLEWMVFCGRKGTSAFIRDVADAKRLANKLHELQIVGVHVSVELRPSGWAY